MSSKHTEKLRERVLFYLNRLAVTGLLGFKTEAQRLLNEPPSEEQQSLCERWAMFKQGWGEFNDPADLKAIKFVPETLRVAWLQATRELDPPEPRKH